VFAAHGLFTSDGLLLTVPVTIVALLGYWAGLRLQSRVRPEVYRKVIRGVLWAMAALLLVQVAVSWAK
jgi:predicted acyltransferase